MSRTGRQHSLLDLEMRRRLMALVKEYPGIHAREAARQLDTSVALVEYHTRILSDADLLRVAKGDRYARLYAVGAQDPTKQDRDLLAILRERLPLNITLHLLDRSEPAKHGDIATALEMSKSKLSFHLRKLEAAGVLRKNKQGLFEIIQPKRLTALLTNFPPTSELRSEFAKLWLSLYYGKP
jgi:predicted transcriptional regulator